MAQIIADLIPQFNKKFSNSTNESVVTTPKPLKLHSADIAYLDILAYHKRHGRGQTDLTPQNWLLELVKFGGKSLHIEKQRERWRKLKRMGFVDLKRMHGNQRSRYVHYITQKGLEAVDNWHLSKQIKNKKRCVESEKTVCRDLKNGVSLNSCEFKTNHVDVVVSQLDKKDTELGIIYRRLIEIGFYSASALSTLKRYKKHELLDVYCLTKQKRPFNPGGYMKQTLKKLYPER
jgi:hypothetical protein